MNRLFFIFSIIIATATLPSHAQISFGGLPTSTHTGALRSSDFIPCISVHPDTTTEIESNQFAYPNDVDIDVTQNASASVVGDKIIYRLMIHSDDAKSINLIFNKIHLPSDAKMYLFRPDGGEIYGAYTNESFTGEVLATTPISGDSIVVQCEVPIANSDSFSASISSVNIGFDDLRLLPELGKAKLCETDVVCQNEEVKDQCRAACLIIINGTRYCSGTLVATEDTDKDAYVLTSAHCLRNNKNMFDSTIANKCIFYFGFNTPICDAQIIGSYEKSISGSMVASSHHEKDMALLRLSTVPPVDYMTYRSGWNVELAPHGPVSCIHHPNGDLMKISISENDPSPVSFEVDGLGPDNHWLVDKWNVGITEDGSSGAPLYDSNGLLIGALSGGMSSCSNRGKDKFWRLNNVWDDISSKPTDLMSVLNPSMSGIAKLNGQESHERRCYSLKNYDSFSELNEPYKEGYGYASGRNSFGLEEFAEKFTSPYSSAEIYGISFIPIIGQYNKSNPVYLRIYDGSDKPEHIVYESVVKITVQEKTSLSPTTTSNTIVSNWSYKENYVRLDSAVTVGKNFFVSLYTDYTNRDFAILTTISDTKTAFFKKNGEWDSWENHPFDNSVGSLLINAVIRESRPSGIQNRMVDKEISVYPNPANDMVNLKCEDEIKAIRIYTPIGASFIPKYSQKSDSYEYTIDIKDLPNGIYTAEITTNKGKYHTKFIKE